MLPLRVAESGDRTNVVEFVALFAELETDLSKLSSDTSILFLPYKVPSERSL